MVIFGGDVYVTKKSLKIFFFEVCKNILVLLFMRKMTGDIIELEKCGINEIKILNLHHLREKLHNNCHNFLATKSQLQIFKQNH